MTQKDYVKLASAIATIRDKRERQRTAELIGKACCLDNPRFNYSIWYNACDIDATKVGQSR